jgi:hypothetical protein
MLFDLENPKHVGIFAICMILLTLGVLLTLSIAMHSLVKGELTNHHIKNSKTIIDYNDPNIPTLIHDNDTDNP